MSLFLFLIIISFVLLEIILVSFEQMGFATLLAMGCAALYSWINWNQVLFFIENYYKIILLFLPVYLVIGMFYSRVRWKFFILSKRNLIKENSEIFKTTYEEDIKNNSCELEKTSSQILRTHNPNERMHLEEKIKLLQSSHVNLLNEEYKKSKWHQFLETQGLEEYSTTPKVFNHKSRIINWIAYWPLSFVWFILNDPITALIKNIYLYMIKGLQKTADKAYEGMDTIYK